MFNEITSMRGMNGGYNKPPLEDCISYTKNLYDGNPDSNQALDFLRIQKNLSEETIKKFLLGYDCFRNNIVIPETKNKEIVNVAYCSLDKDAKVKYTKEKGCENWVFNEEAFNVSKNEGRSILITGNQFDCMSAWQAGFRTTVSIPYGKDATGSWVELFDSVSKIYICFENTKASKKFGLEFADRLGIEKCNEIELPEDCKDLSAYFKTHSNEEFKVLIKKARPYYKYTYSGLSDIITELREKKDEFFVLKCIPYIEWEYGMTTVLSGVTNIGKTSVSLNIANELVGMGLQVLVLPIERGVTIAGKRFLQVRYSKSKDELRNTTEEEWEKIIPDVIDLPIYFSNPKVSQLEETIVKSKKLFNTKFIIVDHLDLLVRKTDPKNYNVELAAAIQNLIRIGQEHKLVVLVIHHIKKQEGVSSVPKKPSLNDLKGTGSVKDDPENVIMLSEPDNGLVEIDILKAKGEMGSRIYQFNKSTGVIGKDVTDVIELLPEKLATQKAFDML